MAYFAPEWVAYFSPEWVAYFAPESWHTLVRIIHSQKINCSIFALWRTESAFSADELAHSDKNKQIVGKLWHNKKQAAITATHIFSTVTFMFFHALSKRYKLLLSLIAQSCPLVRLGKEKTIYGHKLPYSSRSDSTRKADSLNKLPDHEVFKEDEF